MNRRFPLVLRAAARALTTAAALAVVATNCEDPVSLPLHDPRVPIPIPQGPPPQEPDSPAAVISALERAYAQRNPVLLQSLLANEHGANADYLFLLSEPSYPGEMQWGYAEEARIHQRMFRPDQLPPGDAAVPSELRVQSITITLTPIEEFQERSDLYSANGGDDGKLNPQKWYAVDARYATYVYWDLAASDYKIEGEANFVVIEDLAKQVGDAGKFLLYIWEDLGYGQVPTLHSEATWSRLKSFYR